MNLALDYAHAYAAGGWPVFVLSPTKTPVRNCDPCRTEHTGADDMEACECLTCHGFYAATTDPDRITEMLRRHPRGLLAVRTGAASGTVVVDVDPPAGLTTLARLDEAEVLPGTVMSMTGRDLGLQMFYAHPGVRITSRAGGLGPGVDVKADDAYVVVPPSVHPRTRRAYRWSGTGRWDYPLTPLHPLLTERLRADPPAPPHPTVHQLGERKPRGRLHGLIETVLTAPPQQGNDALFWAACRVGDMVAAGEVDEATGAEALHMAAVERGRPSAEAWRTIRSGMKRGAA